MANPTTNFGWVMPTSSSLVTNLPADFNTFGQAVDTSMSELLGGTTGQVLSKTSNTSMDFTWVTPTDQSPLTTKGDLFTFTTVDARLGVGTNGYILSANSATATGLEWIAANPGDITGVTAGTGISGGGTSGDVTVTNSMATAMTTKGDLVPATGSAAFARLGVGSNNQVLTADSAAATGMKWATPAGGGGMTLLSTTSLSGATTTISSIDQTYTQLFMTIEGVTNATGDGAFRINPNGADTVQQITINGNNNTVTTTADYGGKITTTASLARANAGNGLSCLIDNYASTSGRKAFLLYGGFINSSSAFGTVNAGGYINTPTSGITSLVFSNVGGNLSTGTVYLYGVK